MIKPQAMRSERWNAQHLRQRTFIVRGQNGTDWEGE